MYMLLWLKRFFLSYHRFIRFTPLMSIFSLMLATATLVLAMSVYSGYETTVRKAIVDVTGHLVITSRKPMKEKKLIDKIQNYKKEIVSYVPFASLKSLLVYNAQLSGILLEGINTSTLHETLKIKKRLIKGTFQLKSLKSAVIGRGIAKKMQLDIGDSFQVIIPTMDSTGMLQKKNQSFNVEGIVDLGFNEFNSRLVIVNINTVRKLLNKPHLISGLRFIVKNPEKINILRKKIRQTLGPTYQVDDWQSIVKSIHESYLQAIRQEKFLIFFILMILVLAGAFNVSSHLSISVLNQIREVNILKIMGASKMFIFSIFILQGFIISFMGTFLGVGLGWILSKGLIWIQNIWQFMPAEVYKINTITTDTRLFDIALILVCSLLICVLACLIPAWRALKLSIKECFLCE